MFTESGLKEMELLPYLGLLNAVSPLIPKTPFKIVQYKTYEEMV